MAKIGSSVPNFNFLDINKNKSSLSDMKGSVVFLNFWATWCGSCIEELPSVERLSRAFSGNPQFKVITILYKDDAQRAFGFMKENGLTFPVYLNSDESAAKIFAITGVPETYIIDKKGILRDKVIGPAEWDSPQAISAFRDLIKEPY
jgi:cytochrome c biogenesis protein CcmG, thiol:disulfide interchange protein DsbE